MYRYKSKYANGENLTFRERWNLDEYAADKSARKLAEKAAEGRKIGDDSLGDKTATDYGVDRADSRAVYRQTRLLGAVPCHSRPPV
jgi:hypothetical protein